MTDCLATFSTRDMLPSKIGSHEIIDLTSSPEPEASILPPPRSTEAKKLESSEIRANDLLARFKFTRGHGEERPAKRARHEERDRAASKLPCVSHCPARMISGVVRDLGPMPKEGLTSTYSTQWQLRWSAPSEPSKPRQSQSKKVPSTIRQDLLSSSHPLSLNSTLQPVPNRLLNSSARAPTYDSGQSMTKHQVDSDLVFNAAHPKDSRQSEPAVRAMLISNSELQSIPPTSPFATATSSIKSEADAQKRKIGIEDVTFADIGARNTIDGAPQPSSAYSSEPYTKSEQDILLTLKGVENRPWDEIAAYFPNRSKASIQVYYSTKVKRLLRSSEISPLQPQSERKSISHHEKGRGSRGRPPVRNAVIDRQLTPNSIAKEHSNGRRSADRSEMACVPQDSVGQLHSDTNTPSTQDHVYPNTLSRLLRVRELGSSSRRAWSSSKTVTNELKNHAHRGSEFIRHYQGMSGDVVALAWSADDTLFAAGSIAISDAQSQQYNMGRNLLAGNLRDWTVREMPEHHIPRPKVEGDNINASHAMRATQDERLFMTVTGTEFTADGTQLYTSSADGTLRRYSIDAESNLLHHSYAIKHEAAVELLSVHHTSWSHVGVVATAARTSSESINIYQCDQTHWNRQFSFSPVHLGSHVFFPSALRFGLAPQHRDFLLVGFSAASEVDRSGQTCLWNISAGIRLSLNVVTHDVFDVAWNPAPSPSSIAFAVACNPSGLQVNKFTRSVVQCFAPDQQDCRRVLVWESPARDINRVVFCQHDDNLVAAGATDGKVYIWDKRFASRQQKPLHTLSHGESLNVLSADDDREMTDTGVHFLAWGATRERLYSGSSDGIVKIWNPYRAVENTHVDDVTVPRSQRAAIMSGAFSRDGRSLLVGTENGNVNLFSIGQNEPTGAAQRVGKFKLLAAEFPPDSAEEPHFKAANDLLETGQIVIRPCGAMPFRQAVQGPRYNGPYLDPPQSQINAAVENCNRALMRQAALTPGRSTLMNYFEGENKIPDQSDTFDVEEINKAQREVSRAEISINDIRSRVSFAQAARPKAEAFQRSLLEMEPQKPDSRVTYHDTVHHCKLDCNVLRTTEDMDGEVDDSARWQLRDPSMLRILNRIPSVGTGQDGVGQKQQDAIMKAGLLTTCSKCHRPARVAIDESRALCENCSFACFRCGKSAAISSDTTRITCASCKLAWEAGALGYDLLNPSMTRIKAVRPQAEDDDELADQELEYYASLWQISDNKY